MSFDSTISLVDPFTIIPDELALKILGFLRVEELGWVIRVCKRWQGLALDPIFFKSVVMDSLFIPLEKEFDLIKDRLTVLELSGAVRGFNNDVISEWNDSKKRLDKGIIDRLSIKVRPQYYSDLSRCFQTKCISFFQHCSREEREKLTEGNQLSILAKRWLEIGETGNWLFDARNMISIADYYPVALPTLPGYFYKHPAPNSIKTDKQIIFTVIKVLKHSWVIRCVDPQIREDKEFIERLIKLDENVTKQLALPPL